MLMSRRTLVKSAAAIGVSQASGSAFSQPSSETGRTIDVHAHYLPPVYRDCLQSAGLTTLDGGMPVPDWSEEKALETMDAVGISGALLSVSSPFLSFMPSNDEIRLCNEVNAVGAEIRARHPTRFGALAVLPLSDIPASIEALSFALDTLELDGVVLPTNVEGDYLGHERFVPLLSAMNERKVTAFVHPTSPCCFEAFNLGLPAPMLEFPFDSTRAVTDLILSGRTTQFPEINFIVPHAGGTLPYLAMRIAGMGQLPVLGSKQTSMEVTLRELGRMNYDLALSSTPAQFQALRQLAPMTNILYGSDYPFTPAPAVMMGEAGVRALPLTPEEAHQIRFGNAARLFPGFAHQCCGRSH